MHQTRSRIRLLLIYLLVSLPVIIYGAIQALQASNNSPIDWVDERFSARRTYDEFVELFGPGDAIIISWPECYWTDERLDQLVHRLRTDAVFRSADGDSYFHSVNCGREMLLQMTGAAQTGLPPFSEQAASALSHEGSTANAPEILAGAASLSISEPVAIQRLQGTLIGKDGRLTCVICTLNSEGLAKRAELVPQLKQLVLDLFELEDSDLRLAGPVIDGLTVDEASHRSLTQFALPSSIVIFLICLFSLRSLVAATVVFLTSALCQGLLLAVIYYSGERLSALLIILPPLVQVLTVSGGIHLMNYYFNALRTMEPRDAAIECFRQGWLPSMLSLGTTAIGTASLMISGLQPIRLFGIYGTVGVLTTAAAVLTVIPCSMMILGKKPREQQTNDDSSPHSTESTEAGGVPGVWTWLAAFLLRFNGLSLLFLFGIMALAAIGLPWLKTSVRIETLYETDSRIMRDYAWLEDRIGALVPIDVLLVFGPECRLNDRQRMDVLWKANQALQQQDSVRSTMSAITLFPVLPRMPGVSATIRASLLNKAVRQAKPAFEQAAMLRTTDAGEIWRLTAHVSALAPLDYGDVLDDVRSVIEEQVASLPAEARESISLTTSGIMPLVHQIQGQLLSDLFNSLMSALLVITLTMTLAQAGFLNGLLAMCSNIFPIVIAFGLMGLLQQPMDIGSVMTASIALGIAVDDTLHFLTFFRRELARPGTDRFSAVLATYLDCGPAMIQTSISCGIGLLVFAFSDFVPTSRFAVLMAFLLMLALLGDLLMLPALLLSPAGRLFETPQETPPEAGMVKRC